MTGGAPGLVALRPASSDDADPLARLHALCFEEVWDAAAFADLLAAPGTGAWIAHDAAGRPAGYAVARVAADQADVLSLAVRPDCRGRGLGRRLLDTLVQGVALADARTVFLEVAESNGPARALYAAAGFRQIGRRRGYYATGRGAQDALVLRLGPPS